MIDLTWNRSQEIQQPQLGSSVSGKQVLLTLTNSFYSEGRNMSSTGRPTSTAADIDVHRRYCEVTALFLLHRPLSRRLDRCDRVIHNESGDPNGGNMCSFSGATCTSRIRHNADYVPYANIRFDL